MASAHPPSSPGPNGDEPEPQGIEPEGAAANIQAAQERPWRPPVYIETFIGGEGWSEEVNIFSRKTYAYTSICTSVVTMNRELESRL